MIHLYPVWYRSQLGIKVAKDSCFTKAQYFIVIKASKEMIWLQYFLEKSGYKYERSVLYCDSQSVIHLKKNHIYHAKTKHI